MTIAMTQYLEARILLRDIAELTELYGQPNPGWTMTQAFYYNVSSSSPETRLYCSRLLESGMFPPRHGREAFV
jgi:hypothetical protein